MCSGGLASCESDEASACGRRWSAASWAPSGRFHVSVASLQVRSADSVLAAR